MTEPPPRRSVWDSAGDPTRSRPVTPPSRHDSLRPQPPPRPGSTPPRTSRKRFTVAASVLAAVIFAVIVVPRLLERQPETSITVPNGDSSGITETARPSSEEPDIAGISNSGEDVADIARSRFFADVQAQEPKVKAELVVESGSPKVAKESLRESLDYAMSYLSRYFEESGDVIVVGLVTARWGTEVLEDRFDNSEGFVSETSHWLIQQDYGLALNECSGTGGFARTDFSQTVVVIDVGASCNWYPGSWIDDSETVAPHELMHVAQFSLTGMCAAVPAWFDEGQAEFVGWNLAVANGVSLYEESRSFVVDDAAFEGYSSLHDLGEYTSDGAEYVIGALAVEMLVAENGWNATVDMLSSLNRKTAGCGAPDPEFVKFETAFETAFGESVSSFSERVWAYAGLN